MCAQYTVEPGPEDLMRLFNALFPEGAEFEAETRVLPHQPAPVLSIVDKKRLVQLMKFSLVPSWSKEPRVKFATHNARLTTHDEKLGRDVFIFEKPTWKAAFQARPCLVPLSSFFEAAYRGPLAGHMVKFTPKHGKTLMAAGIWENWTSRETGEVVVSFAILTDEPSDEIRHYGHDRCPVFLDEGAWETWLDPKPNQNDRDKVGFLKGAMHIPSLSATSDRPLKPGWEKRKPR